MSKEHKEHNELNIIERYLIRANIWEIVDVTLPFGVSCPASKEVNNCIYIFGGYIKTYGNQKTVTGIEPLNDHKVNYLRDLLFKGKFITEPTMFENKIHLYKEEENEEFPSHIPYNY